jgi:hypothetical protein
MFAVQNIPSLFLVTKFILYFWNVRLEKWTDYILLKTIRIQNVGSWKSTAQILRTSCISVLLTQPYKIIFMGPERTIIISLVGSRMIFFPISKIWFLILHPAGDIRHLPFTSRRWHSTFTFYTTRSELQFSSGNF